MKIKSILCVFLCLCVLGGCSGQAEQTAASKPATTSTVSRQTKSTAAKSSATTSATVSVAEAPAANSKTTCSHVWQDATCTKPRTCAICNQTTGSPLGHSYSGRYCTRCGATNPNYTETVEVSSVYLDQYSETIYIGQQITLNYSISPSNATNPSVTWSSSNSGVATVNSSGVVTGVSAGEATITVAAANGRTDDCTITVKEDVVAKCSLSIPSCPITVDEYNYSGSRVTTTNVTGIRCEFEENYDGTVELSMYFSGEKTYDSRGAGQSSSCKIGWKIYDADNYVVEDGTVYTTAVSMGEKYRDNEETVYSLAPGAYRLEILDVN